MKALLAVTLLGFATTAIAQVPATPAPGPAGQAQAQAAIAPEALHSELRKMRSADPSVRAPGNAASLARRRGIPSSAKKNGNGAAK